jgi:hypothetical protein
MVPVLIGVVVDRAVARGSLGALFGWLAVLGAVYVGLSFSFRFGARAGERAAEQAAHRLRMDLVRRVLHPAGGAENGRLPGALATLATEDARRVGSVNTGLVFGTSALMGLVVAAVVLLRTSLPLGLVVLLGTPAVTAMGHLLSKPLEQRSETEQERAADASGVAADLVAGLRGLKGLGAVPAAGLQAGVRDRPQLRSAAQRRRPLPLCRRGPREQAARGAARPEGVRRGRVPPRPRSRGGDPVRGHPLRHQGDDRPRSRRAPVEPPGTGQELITTD